MGSVILTKSRRRTLSLIFSITLTRQPETKPIGPNRFASTRILALVSFSSACHQPKNAPDTYVSREITWRTFECGLHSIQTKA
jgi:hypothetical protein